MSRPAIAAAWLLQAMIGLCTSGTAYAQGLSVDISAGSVVYDPLSANVGTANAVGTLRYDALRGMWVYGTAATPLRSGDPLWGGFGAGGRFMSAPLRRLALGVDLGGHGFFFRDAVFDDTGRGLSIDALPFVRIASGLASVELRSGWRGHTMSTAGITENRNVWETGGRVGYGGSLRVSADARWVKAPEGSYPFLGGTLSNTQGPWQAWVQAGKWLNTELDDVTWGGGVSVAITSRSTLWTTVQQAAPDPLYWNAPRRSWGIGFTQQLTRAATPTVLPARLGPGRIEVRVPAADVSATRLMIAGDFNNWQPLPMTREGTQWIARLTLDAGVYHYAFRAGDGDWFVPSSVAGRRSDGMGGYVAILVVE